MADDNSTGHVFDEDLIEINNPLPLWWMVLFVITVVFSRRLRVSLPGPRQQRRAASTGPVVRSYRTEQENAKRVDGDGLRAVCREACRGLACNAQAMAIGERLFINNCAACHGSDARGSKGFPT